MEVKFLKPKVLCITNVPAPYTVDFYNELGNYVDLTVLFERKSADNRNNEWFNIDCCNFKSIYLNGRKFGNEMAVCFNVQKYISKTYDLVIVGNYSSPTGVIAIRKLRHKKIPFFIHADGGIINKENFFKFKLKRCLLSAADGYFSSGKQTDEYFKHYTKNTSNIFRYPFTSIREKDLVNSVKRQEEKRVDRQGSIFKEQHIVLFVGSFIHRKGIDILINIAKYLSPQIGVYAVGGVPNEEMIKQIESAHIKNMHFVEFSSFQDVLGYMRLADLFVFPTRYDIWGLVINEAMSQGMPVITSNNCVAGLELIEDGNNGDIVNTEDAAVWAEKIENLIFDSDKLYDMSKLCLDKMQEYTIENMAKRYAEHILDFCKNKVKDYNY